MIRDVVLLTKTPAKLESGLIRQLFPTGECENQHMQCDIFPHAGLLKTAQLRTFPQTHKPVHHSLKRLDID